MLDSDDLLDFERLLMNWQ